MNVHFYIWFRYPGGCFSSKWTGRNFSLLFSNHLSSLAKTWTLLSSNGRTLSFKCKWMAKSCLSWLCCLEPWVCYISVMYRSVHSSLHWTDQTTFIYLCWTVLSFGWTSQSVLLGSKRLTTGRVHTSLITPTKEEEGLPQAHLELKRLLKMWNGFEK